MKLNLGQRIAILIALGVVLHVSCQAILYDDNLGGGGWFNYAPNGSHLLQSPLDNTKFSTTVELLVFGAHVGAWLAAALWLLRDRDGSSGH